MERFIIALICAFILLLSSCAARERVYPDGARVGEVDVAGKNEADARKAVYEHYENALRDISYTIHTSNGDRMLDAYALGLGYEISDAMNDAFSGKNGKLVLSMDEGKAKMSVDALCSEMKTEPVSASAEYDGAGGFTFTDGRDGEIPDAEDIMKKLEEAVKTGNVAEIDAKMLKIAPKGKTRAELEAENTLIAEYTTRFDRSPLNAENRVGNIKKAAGLVNGTVLSPGETFDTNAVLGDRNEENGWFTAPGIVNGKYKQEYGGGVCQVSTTLYNAVLLADLKVNERTPHSIPVSYVDLGRDATISTGGPNLVFTNSSSCALTISAVVDEADESITVRIFGKAPEGYARVEIYSEQTGIIYPSDPEYVRDTSLRMGEYVTDRSARNGKRAATYRIFYDENGNKIKTETVSRDTYTAFNAVILYNN